MTLTYNYGNSADFGKVTISNSNASSATWKNSSNVTVGNWYADGNTAILPVDVYTVTYSNAGGATATASVTVPSSPICYASSIGANEGSTSLAGTNYVSTLTDLDANTYSVVQIGSQCWMKENMKCTKLIDDHDPAGIPIGEAGENYMYPNQNSGNKNNYGLLYCYNDINSICPDGWTIPFPSDWTELTDFVSSRSAFVCGTSTADIAKALASDYTDWTADANNTCVVGNTMNSTYNNTTGFSALPAGGYKFSDFDHMDNTVRETYSFGEVALFWSYSSRTKMDFRRLKYNESTIYSPAPNTKYDSTAYSVRCIREYIGGTPIPVLPPDDDPGAVAPTLSTSAVGTVTATTAELGGNITSNGGAAITSYGICWSTSANPTTADSKYQVGNTDMSGAFTHTITSLDPETTYHVRAYATNSEGTSYGEDRVFTTAYSDDDPDF